MQQSLGSCPSTLCHDIVFSVFKLFWVGIKSVQLSYSKVIQLSAYKLMMCHCFFMAWTERAPWYAFNCVHYSGFFSISSVLDMEFRWFSPSLLYFSVVSTTAACLLRCMGSTFVCISQGAVGIDLNAPEKCKARFSALYLKMLWLICY